MAVLNALWVNFTLLLCFGRPLLVLATFGGTLWVMISGLWWGYVLGLGTLMGAMVFDWLHWILSNKYIPDSKLVPVVNRMMDRLVISIVFPLLGAGMVWRYALLERLGQASAIERLHMVFVLGLSVLVLVRDQLVLFLLKMSQQAQEEGELRAVGRWRMLAFYPIAVLIYANAFWSPVWETSLSWWTWVGKIPVRFWFFLEISFLILCVASVTLHLRKYTANALERITGDDEDLRLRILSVVPNSFTLLNAVLGILAVVFANFGLLREAMLLLLGAGMFDRLDGFVARRLGLTNDSGPRQLGVWLDILSDTISFCIAPALIFYITLSAIPEGQALGIWIPMLAALYALAGVWRLIMFAIGPSAEPGFFRGMPTPGGAGMVVAPLVVLEYMVSGRWSFGTQNWVLVCIGSLLVGAVMMSACRVRYLHIGRLLGRKTSLSWISGLGIVIGMWTPYFGFILMAYGFIYLISPLFTRSISSAEAIVEEPPS